MINLIFCIISLIFGIMIQSYEYKFKLKELPAYILCARLTCFFSFGFFLFETIKWIMNIQTLIF